MIVFILQARKKRSGAAKKAWLSAAATFLVFPLLGIATETPAERQTREVNQAAEQQATTEAQAAVQRAAAEASAKREAEQKARANAEAEAAAARARLAIDEAEFIVGCKRIIRERLKLPDSAKFAGIMESIDDRPDITETEASWGSWVEAENSFGGRVRNNFVCSYTKADNTIRVKMLD